MRASSRTKRRKQHLLLHGILVFMPFFGFALLTWCATSSGRLGAQRVTFKQIQ